LRVALVIFYTAEGCSLCARALEVVRDVQREQGFELVLVHIDEDPELEARYREHLPAVEIDGELAFTYFVDPDALRRRVRPAVLPAKPEEPLAES
jgi:DNA-binding LacI/PurR family transcriptional regulator